MNPNNFFTIETISLATTAFFNFILFITILLKKGKTRNVYYFLGFVLSLFMWVTTTLLFYLIQDTRHLLIDAHLIYFGPAFIPMFMILFIKTFPNQKLGYSVPKLTLFLFFPFLVSVLSIVPGLVIKSVSAESYIKTISYGPLYFIYFIYICTYFTFVLYLMIEKYLILRGRERSQVEMIFLCLTIGSLVGVTCGLLLPTLGRFTLFWVGSVYPGCLVIAIFYGIVRYGLFDMKLVATQFITLSTWVLLFIKIIFFDTNNTDRIIDAITLLLIIVSGILIIKAVTKEIVLREKDDQLVNSVRALNQKLEKTNIDLKALDQKKSEFMSLATHQLRAPLTAMKGYSSMILDGTFGKIDNPEMEDAINKISRSTTDLTMIVEDYLNISRIEQGRMQYNFATIDIVNLVKNIISDVKSTTDRLGLTVSLNCDANTKYSVNVDEGKIRQVFSNIIDNAVKYTPSGRIDVYITKTEGNKIIVKIEDTGVGIKSEVLPSLFHKFVRAPDASRINILGTGLGLYVAGEILKAHNGRAWGESDGEGKGSRFYVELPAA